MSRILVTGASGFVGSCLCRRLESESKAFRRVLRQPITKRAGDVLINDLDPNTDWSGVFEGVDVVVHLAARVHLMRDHATSPLTAFRHINTEGTVHLASSAARAGVSRLIYISSIKVNGESSLTGKPLSADDPVSPRDPYAISKYEAERSLKQLAKETGMEVVIIRPPLVYGPGVKANFLSMMQWLYKGIPLPFGAIHNRRSLVALENLVDLIVTCIDHPAAANQTLLVSDDEDLSTTDLLRRMAAALNRPVRLLPVPMWMLNAGAVLTGKRDLAQRLLGTLQVDINKTRELLDWKPVITVDEALKKTASDYLSQYQREH